MPALWETGKITILLRTLLLFSYKDCPPTEKLPSSPLVKSLKKEKSHSMSTNSTWPSSSYWEIKINFRQKHSAASPEKQNHSCDKTDDKINTAFIGNTI